MDNQTWIQRLLMVMVFPVLADSGPILGPAEVNFKYLEKCKWVPPTNVPMDIRMYQRRGKLVLQANTTFPFPFSDDIGYDMNVAVKRSGAWISNFLKFRGKDVCTGIKAGEKTLFNMIAQQLKAPEPYRCPLPPGTIHLNYDSANPTAAMKQYGLEVMPYGEFRVSSNVSHKDDVFLCVRAFVDLVPKSPKKKSG